MSLPRVNARTIASVLIVVVLFLAIVPFAPAPPLGDAPACDADPSLSLILQEAHARGLQFGTEHIYTYGPLGFTTFFLFAPRYAGVHMVADVLLALAASVGLWLVALRLPIWMRFLLPVGFAWAASNIHPRTDLIIDTTLLCFGLLCLVEGGRRLVGCVIVLAAMAAFGALSKNSFLFSAPVTVVMVSAALWMRGRRLLGVGTVLGFGVAFVAGWLAAGQNLMNLPRFVSNALVMVKAYNEALGWETSISAGRAGVAVTALLLVAVSVRAVSHCSGGSAERRQSEDVPGRGASICGVLPSRRYESLRAITFLWLMAVAFAAWKHGFVRAHAGNVQMFFAYAAVLAVAVQILPASKRVIGVFAFLIGLGCWVVAAISLQTLYFQPAGSSVAAVGRAVLQNARTLVSPREYRQQMTAMIHEHERKAQLPEFRERVGNASVDVFGQQQAYAIYNHLNYRPRPGPQSYAVCSAALMGLNEAYYLSKAAPEYVLFALDPLDRKFPVMEDALVLRTLLFKYELAGKEGPLLLLRRQALAAPALQLLHEQVVHASEPINLRSFGSNALWIQIELTPTLAGRVRQILLRPGVVRLTAWDSPGGKPLLRRRAPAPMLAAGFVASPLLVNTGDVLSLYEGGRAIRPGAYSVEYDAGEGPYWRQEAMVKVYRIGD